MERAFQTALWLLKPEIVFILGDIFDEGKWSSQKVTLFSMFCHAKMFVMIMVVVVMLMRRRRRTCTFESQLGFHSKSARLTKNMANTDIHFKLCCNVIKSVSRKSDSEESLKQEGSLPVSPAASPFSSVLAVERDRKIKLNRSPNLSSNVLY